MSLFEDVDDGVSFHVVKVNEKVGFVLFGYLVDVVFVRPGYDMEMHVIHLETALLHERPVVLPDIAAVAQHADDPLFDEEDQLEYIVQFFAVEFPGFFDVPLRDYQEMSGHFVRVAENNVRALILPQDMFPRVAETAFFCINHRTLPFQSYGYMLPVLMIQGRAVRLQE